MLAAPPTDATPATADGFTELDVVGCGRLLDGDGVVPDCVAEMPGVVFRGDGNRIGVTATTIAVSNSAIESLLSIYGTGSNPPGRKG